MSKNNDDTDDANYKNNDYYNHNDNTNDNDYGKNTGVKGTEEVVVTPHFCSNSTLVLIIY